MIEQHPPIEQNVFQLIQAFLTESNPEYRMRALHLSDSLQQLGIDSIAKAELFQRIENQLHIELPDNALGEVNSIEELMSTVEKGAPAGTSFSRPQLSVNPTQTAIIPDNAKTLIDVLVAHALSEPNRIHIYLQDEHGHEETLTYGALLDHALRVACELKKRGLKPHDTVAIMQPTQIGFFYTFFGILLAGCVPVPIYPPFRAHQLEAYAKHEAVILRNAEARLLVTFKEAETLSHLLRAFIPSLKEVTTVQSLLQHNEKIDIFPVMSKDAALIQYTSGSTSSPKGVLLSHQNLLSNIRSYGKAIQVCSTDVAVSWAPLYHDLGLIGMWLGSLYHGVPLVLMSPLTFLNRPAKWLWAIHHHQGTISGGPNFAYELCITKITPESIEGLDLSSWRLAVNGAEAIQPRTLTQFTKTFAPYGFNPKAAFPVYGLAESTVAVSTSPLNRLPRIDTIERKSFEEKKLAIAAQHADEKDVVQFVSCGVAIPDHHIRIVNDHQVALPERQVGSIQFQGPSSMQGYYGNTEATQAIYHQGWWDTGDLGYLADGELFITGRKKDIIIKAGRNLHPPEIEDITASIPGIRKGCIIAFGITDAQRGTEKLVIVAETAEKNKNARQQLIEQITAKINTILDVMPDHVILAAPRTVPKTSSGKLQRVACKTAYLAGKLSPKGIPIWLQSIKLGLRFTAEKTKQSLLTLAKCVYTLYVDSVILVSLIPVWLGVWLLPRKIAAIITKGWARLLFVLALCPIKLIGKENLSATQPVVYASNHASYIDGLLMVALLPLGTRLAGKSELMSNWVTRVFMKKLGYIPVNRFDSYQGIKDTEQMVALLNSDASISIFPEGTFQYGVGLRTFKSGAFKIAVQTGVPICPIALQGTRYILRDGEWLMWPRKITVRCLPPIKPLHHDWQEIIRLKNEVRHAIAAHCDEPIFDLLNQQAINE